MNAPQVERALEERMDRIGQLLEELVLDTVIGVLGKVSERSQIFANHYRQWNCYRTGCKDRDDIPF